MEKCVRISRIIITILVFIVLNSWFLYENDPQWNLSIILSGAVFLLSYPSSKICKFIINKGDRITNKLFKVLYYAFALPIIFFLVLVAVLLLCNFIVRIFYSSIDLGTAVLIACAGIGLITCILVPYFQTLIILILRLYKSKSKFSGKKTEFDFIIGKGYR